MRVAKKPSSVCAQWQSASATVTTQLQAVAAAHGIPKHLIPLFIKQCRECIDSQDCVRNLTCTPHAAEREQLRQIFSGKSLMDIRIELVKNILFNCVLRDSCAGSPSNTDRGGSLSEVRIPKPLDSQAWSTVKLHLLR